MDTTSKNVSDLYKKFPYPFPSSQIKNVNELLNLFKIFSIENNFLVMGTTNKTEFCKMLDYSKITMFTMHDY